MTYSHKYLNIIRIDDISQVYDGDSISKVRVDLGFNVWIVVNLRLAGLNAPEARGASKTEGLVSRDYLRAMLAQALENGKSLVWQSIKYEKYGRSLGVLFIADSEGLTNVNELMLEKGYATPYLE